MRVAVFSPFGGFSREAGLVYLLANYLRGIFPEVVQLRCNGTFAVCDRDSEKSWRREISSCLECMRDQEKLASWAGLPIKNFSEYLLPEDVEQTRAWILGLPTTALSEVEVNGLSLSKLCVGTFQNRFGSMEIDWHNKQHEQFIRRIYLGATRVCMALERFNRLFLPSMCFVLGGDDYLSRSFLEVSRLQKLDTILFRLDLGSRGVQITRVLANAQLSCDLLLEDISLMRADFKTWPSELLEIVDQVLNFAGVSDTQLDLPISR